MDLETLLPALRSLGDLPRLVAALGHQPLWEELPAGRHDRGASSKSPIMVVGKTAELPWLAIEAASPDGAARRLALRMSRVGRPCMVLALAPCDRVWSLSLACTTAR